MSNIKEFLAVSSNVRMVELMLARLLLVVFMMLCIPAPEIVLVEKEVPAGSFIIADETYKASIDAATEQGRQTATLELEQKITDKAVPFQPITALAKKQEALCLAIMTFTESRGDKGSREDVAWSVVNRAMDERDNSVYRNSICGVIVSDSQYSGMPPYYVDVKDIVYGDISEFTPALAKKSKEDMTAWNEILILTDEIMHGHRARTTMATHFISFSGLAGKTFPSWVKAFKPLGASGLHSFYKDYGYDKEGKLFIFTKERPYNPKKYK